MDSLQFAHVFVILGSSALDLALQVCLTMLSRRQGSPPSAWWRCFCCPKGLLLAYSQLGAHKDPQSLFYQAAFLLINTRLSWCLRLFQCRTWPLHLLNFMRFTLAYVPSLLMSPWITAWLSGVSATPSSLVPSANLLWVHCPIIQIANESVKQYWQDSYSTPLVTGLQLNFELLITTLIFTIYYVFFGGFFC